MVVWNLFVCCFGVGKLMISSLCWCVVLCRVGSLVVLVLSMGRLVGNRLRCMLLFVFL